MFFGSTSENGIKRVHVAVCPSRLLCLEQQIWVTLFATALHRTYSYSWLFFPATAFFVCCVPEPWQCFGGHCFWEAQRNVLSVFLQFWLVISVSCRFKDLSDLRSEGEGAPLQLFSSVASWLGVRRRSQDTGNVVSWELQRPHQDNQTGGKTQGELSSQSPAARISKQGWGNLRGLFMHCFTYLHMYGMYTWSDKPKFDGGKIYQGKCLAPHFQTILKIRWALFKGGFK